jgi:hypothetical protein
MAGSPLTRPGGPARPSIRHSFGGADHNGSTQTRCAVARHGQERPVPYRRGRRSACGCRGGATVLRELNDPDYGSRGSAVTDPEGNLWSLGTCRGEPRAR